MKKKEKVSKKDVNKEDINNTLEELQDSKNNEASLEADVNEENSPEVSAIDKLQADLAESKDKYLRLYSEFDNYRRRTAREKLDLMQTAGERIVVSLLPVIDDFSRAEDSLASNDAEAIANGIRLITDKFRKTLENEGLTIMETKVGTAFNPDLHEAVTQIPASSKKLKGKIVDTLESGYFLGEKVIRHAKVVIGA